MTTPAHDQSPVSTDPPTTEKPRRCCCRKGAQGCDKAGCRCCKVAVGGLVLLLLLVLGAELFARYYLGLGDPPLVMADDKIEYLFQPNQSGKRFGNHYYYNAFSMRSDDFPKSKTDSNELRVMVLGDSVVNGGGHIDQMDLPTTVLQDELRQKLKRPVFVGNISAGSWGPANMLAYVEKFGWFDADVVVIVLSSHDAFDAPTFVPLVGVDVGFPDRKPWLALTELFGRYGAVVRWWFTGEVPDQQTEAALPTEQAEATSLQALRELINQAKAVGAKVWVAQHFEVGEMMGSPQTGYGKILQVCREMNVPVVPLFEAMREASKAGQAMYRDQWVHPSAAGNRVIGQVLAEEVARRLGE